MRVKIDRNVLEKRMDLPLFLLVVGLLVFGIIMMYSASAIWADQHGGDHLHFLKKQIIWITIGLIFMGLLSAMDYNRLKEWVWPLLAVTWIFLVAVFFAPPVGGTTRWIRLGPIGFQPSELAKLTIIIFLAYYLDRKKSKLENFSEGFAYPMAITGTTMILIGLEPDLGTPALTLLVAMMVFFVTGTKAKYIAATLACSVPILAYELLKYPYRLKRLMQFISPFEDPLGTGYQLTQSLLAVGSGGWAGRGLGCSKLKLLYLPTPHTDFIFPVICEELGLLGSLGVLALFVMLLWQGIQIARRAPNLFGALLATGITFLICFQAFSNIAVTIGLMPVKGLPLPFFSFGGSSIVVTLASMGIMLSIARRGGRSTSPSIWAGY